MVVMSTVSWSSYEDVPYYKLILSNNNLKRYMFTLSNNTFASFVIFAFPLKFFFVKVHNHHNHLFYFCFLLLFFFFDGIAKPRFSPNNATRTQEYYNHMFLRPLVFSYKMLLNGSVILVVAFPQLFKGSLNYCYS